MLSTAWLPPATGIRGDAFRTGRIQRCDCADIRCLMTLWMTPWHHLNYLEEAEAGADTHLVCLSALCNCADDDCVP